MSLLLWVLGYVNYFLDLFKLKDYTIQKVTLEYVVTGECEEEEVVGGLRETAHEESLESKRERETEREREKI